MLYIATHFGISFDEGQCSITEIENALREVFGSGSTIITDRMYNELQTLPE
jgi:hypothetical protein